MFISILYLLAIRISLLLSIVIDLTKFRDG
jgi:hypothetical protein